MLLMNIPMDFKWIDSSIEELNSLSINKKKSILKTEERTIRQCIGEAVPTIIFEKIEKKIKCFFIQEFYTKFNKKTDYTFKERNYKSKSIK